MLHHSVPSLIKRGEPKLPRTSPNQKILGNSYERMAEPQKTCRT